MATLCRRCEATEAGKPTDGLKHQATTEVPSVEQLQEWMSEGGCEATDGCWVESDRWLLGRTGREVRTRPYLVDANDGTDMTEEAA